MMKPNGMSGREYYHYKRLNNVERYSPIARACRNVTDFQNKKINKIIDLGSSCGVLLKELEIVYGIKDTIGLDVSEFAEKHWCSTGIFIKADLNKFNVEDVSFDMKSDLIVSFEMAEHLGDIESLFKLTSDLSKENSTMIFGAATPFQKSSKGHSNCRWPSWWIEEYKKLGWNYDHLSTTRFAYHIGEENSKGMRVPMYYLNAIVFRKDNME